MISIRRGQPCPDILRGSPTDADHFDDLVVVKALWEMQHGKCCYCECKIPRSGAGQNVEHFRPKETRGFKRLRNSWRNLLHACPQCNVSKGTQFPTDSKRKPLLLDPSSRTDPEKHITFVTGEHTDEPIGLPIVNNRSRRGRKTIEVLRLWEVDSIRARHRFFRKEVLPAHVCFDQALRRKQNRKLARAIADFNQLLSANSPFAGFVRAFARNRRLDQYGITIPVQAG